MGRVLADQSVGDYCFGYSSEPIPGHEPRSKKEKSPPRQYTIVPEEAEWVRKIFDWYVNARLAINEIVRRLNRAGAPKDHRATTKEWTHQLVTGLLRNRKYIGEWQWGRNKNVRDPLMCTVRREPRSEEEIEDWLRDRPDLQIVDTATFMAAQELLEQLRQNYEKSRQANGQLHGSTPYVHGEQPRHLLSGIVECRCGARYECMGGLHPYMKCPKSRLGTCDCHTQLRRDVAEERVVAAVRQQIGDSPELIDYLCEQVVEFVKQFDNELPAEMEALENELRQVKHKIVKLVDRIETDDLPELTDRLKERKTECQRIKDRLARLQTEKNRPRPEPTREGILSRLEQLSQLLAAGTPAARKALRDILQGPIKLQEVEHDRKNRKSLRGTLTISRPRLLSVVSGSRDAESSPQIAPDDQIEIEIDFRIPPEYEMLADTVKEMFDGGLSQAQIAAKLDRSNSFVKRASDHWYRSRGLPIPDRRRVGIRRKTAPQPDRLMSQIIPVWLRDIPMMQVGREVGCSYEIAKVAVDRWHERNGLPLPDGRGDRRNRRQKVIATCRELNLPLPDEVSELA